MRTNYPTREIGNEIDYEFIRRALVDHGIVVAKLDDPRLSWVDREELKRIATKIVGPTAR